MQINDAFKYAKQKLDSSNYRRIDSEILLCSILNCNRTKLYAYPDKVLSFDDKKKYKELLINVQKVIRLLILQNKKSFGGIHYILMTIY